MLGMGVPRELGGVQAIDPKTLRGGREGEKNNHWDGCQMEEAKKKNNNNKKKKESKKVK